MHLVGDKHVSFNYIETSIIFKLSYLLHHNSAPNKQGILDHSRLTNVLGVVYDTFEVTDKIAVLSLIED